MRRFLSPSALLLVLAVAGCASGPEPDFESPRVTLVNLEELESSGIQQRYRVTLRVQNRNRFPLSISGYAVNLSLNGHNVADGVNNSAMELAGLSEELVTVDTTTNAFRLLESVLDFPGRTSLTYGVNGTLYIQRDIEWTTRFWDNGELRLPGGSGPTRLFERAS